MSPSLLSYHLKTLREAGLIMSERRGRWIDYALVSATFEALSETLAPASSELARDPKEVCATWGFSSVS